MSRATAAVQLALAGAVALACGRRADPAAPRWVDLARLHRPPPSEEIARRLEARIQPPRGGRFVRRGEGGEELWFELPLPRTAWSAREDGTWITPIPSGGALLASERISAVVVDGERELQKSTGKKGPDQFDLGQEGLVVTLAPGSEPSPALAYRVRLELGREVDGRWRAAQWDIACDGMLVVPGEPVKLRVEIPPASRLSFASVSPELEGHGRGAELAPTTFRVRLDGRTLLENAQTYRRSLRAAWNELELGAEGEHELAFEVDGPAPALIGMPLLGPSDPGRPGARPWKDPRPDIVLVLCDTFRADSLSAWGGAPDVAPHLDRFVERSLRFLDARAVAAWTLPSIASMLTGLFPGQHGATDYDRGVAEGAETIAEVLARAGYRTLAVTDSNFASRIYGQDQGFQWFEEVATTEWSLATTLAKARALLAADDGRPTFLLVHTYRVHEPVRVGPDEDPGPARELSREIRARTEERRRADRHADRMDVKLEFAAREHALYLDAVRDLDRKLGAWFEALEQAGFLAHGVLVLTADHGQAYGEHRQFGHGGDMYDVKLRVPLALAGAGIAPRAVTGIVSLIDLAPTLAALAGAAPSPTWPGRSLLGIVPGDPVCAFDFKKGDQQVALFAQGKKLIARDIAALRSGTPSHAFDLAADPREEHDVAGEAAWAAEIGRELAGALEPLVVPVEGGKELVLPPALEQQLRDLGYGGDESGR